MQWFNMEAVSCLHMTRDGYNDFTWNLSHKRINYAELRTVAPEAPEGVAIQYFELTDTRWMGTSLHPAQTSGVSALTPLLGSEKDVPW